MSWAKFFKKVVIGALQGGTATVVATQGDIPQTAIGAAIVGALTGLVNFFKNVGR